jgi:Hemolysin-type calcium-binding repeat (2 copies).
MATRIGNDSANELVGTSLADLLDGRGGDDLLRAFAGNDTLLGGDGNDRLQGGAGDDLLDGQRGNDTLLGKDGNDQLYGRGGYDSLYGGGGNDQLSGGSGKNQIDAGDGNDSILAGKGFDTINGGTGIDTISFVNADGPVDAQLGDLGSGPADVFSEIGGNHFGGTASDIEIIVGSRFDDTLRGGLGITEIHGGSGNDRLFTDEFPAALFGDSGDDILLPSTDGDTSMTGGSGKDTFEILYGETFNSGGSEVNDFTPGEDQLLFFGDKSTEPFLTNNGDIWLIHFDDPDFGELVTAFQIVGITSLSASDYEFV